MVMRAPTVTPTTGRSAAMPVQIVEPTLASDAGHCAAIFSNLHRAAPDIDYQLWVDRHAQAPSVAATGAAIRRHFIRPLRRLQALPLYRRLLRGPDPVYVPTATYFDLEAIALLAPRRLERDNVFLYFHKWRATPQRQQALQRLARKQPHLHLLGASPTIAQHLRAGGFGRVDTVVPINAEAGLAKALTTFHHLLFAGAARADKGFTHIVDLAAWLASQPEQWPFVVQTTGDHYGRYDERTRADLARLRNLNYPALRCVNETPDRQQYAQLFPGSICLQPYDRNEYAEKTSSVTFDALMAGAPIVTLSGTPMAQWVSDFGAGLVVEDARPETLLAAARTIRDNYTAFAAHAREAGARLDPKQAWAPVVAAFRRGLERAR